MGTEYKKVYHVGFFKEWQDIVHKKIQANQVQVRACSYCTASRRGQATALFPDRMRSFWVYLG
jgi:hypothetical protein